MLFTYPMCVVFGAMHQYDIYIFGVNFAVDAFPTEHENFQHFPVGIAH